MQPLLEPVLKVGDVGIDAASLSWSCRPWETILVKPGINPWLWIRRRGQRSARAVSMDMGYHLRIETLKIVNGR